MVAIATLSCLALISTFPHDTSLELMRRWKPDTLAALPDSAHYISAVVNLHRPSRRCYAVCLESHVHLSVVDESDCRVHFLEGMLWSPGSSKDDKRNAFAHLFEEHRERAHRSLVPRLGKGDSDLWYGAMRGFFFK